MSDSAVRLLVTLGARSAWCPTAKVLLEAKQQLCIQNGTRSYYLNYLQRGRVRAGKRSAGIRDWLANQIDRNVMDRQIEDRQTDRNKTDERWYLSRLCSVLNSGLRRLRR